MTDTAPADLAKFIHPVPVGATIPAGMEWVNRDGRALTGPHKLTRDFVSRSAAARWTAEPLAAPKPPLPTEVGAVIANVVPVPLIRGCDPEPSDTCAVMVRNRYGHWYGVDASGGARCYRDREIADWKPARIVIDDPADPETIRAIRARKEAS